VITICKKFHFDAAHRLPNYEGQCANLHGHRWEVEVEIAGEIDSKTGMIVDFGILKSMVKETFLDEFDHSYLNNHSLNPTVENLLRLIVAYLRTTIGIGEMVPFLRLVRVRLYESPDAYAEWRVDE